MPTQDPKAPLPRSNRMTLENLLGWARAHQEVVAVIGILFLLTFLGVPYYLYSREKSEKDSLNVLSLAQFYFHAQVDPQKGFKTNSEKFQQALTTFQRVTTDFKGTRSSKIAHFYVGKCQFFLGQFIPAYSSFELASRELRGTPLGEEASYGRILCLEAQKQFNQAITLGESFLKEHPESFLIPEVRTSMARIHLLNKDQGKARELLQKTASDHPGTHWGKEAKRRLNQIKP